MHKYRKRECKIDYRIGSVAAVLQLLYQSVVAKQDVSFWIRLSVPHCHLWAWAVSSDWKKIRSQVQLGFSAGLLGFSILWIDSSHWLRWFEHYWNSIRHVPLDTDPEPAGEIISHSWLGNVWLGIEKYGLMVSSCCHCIPTMKTGRKMNGRGGRERTKASQPSGSVDTPFDYEHCMHSFPPT